MLETTTVGSLPKPEYLAETEKLWPAWRLSGEALEQAKERATVEWLRHQEDAGIHILTAGEQHRIHFVHGFLENIQGIDWEKKTPMGIRDNRYTVDVPTVIGPVSSPQPVHLDEVQFIRAQTDRRIKFTLPGPMTICDTIANAHYATRADMAMAFADILNIEARKLEAAGLHGGRQGMGHRRAPPSHRGVVVHYRRTHLLRVRYRRESALERDSRQRVAPVRGDLPGT
jgi:5-methyltetrahydropteroyltriglutamate--homocysteine methyltransferase